jgi:hypothetical protein
MDGQARFQVGQFVMRTVMTPEQEALKHLPPVAGGRAGLYPWARLTIMEVCPDECGGFCYTCRDEEGRIECLREDDLREVDPSEKHGWRGE